MKRRIAFAYLTLLHFLLAAMLWKSDFLPLVMAKAGFSESQTREIGDRYRRTLAAHLRSCPNVPAGATLFIGDSLVQGQCVASICPLSVNYGISGDTTLGVLERLDDYQPAIANASRVVLSIGVNDLKWRSNDAAVENYSSILDRLDDKPVFVSSVLPVDPASRVGIDDYPHRIHELNDAVRGLCDARSNCTFIDNAGVLDLNGDGSLDADAHVGDGIHLNPTGNARWAANLRKSLDPPNASDGE